MNPTPRIPVGQKIADAVADSFDQPVGAPIFTALQHRRHHTGMPIKIFAGIGASIDTTTPTGRDQYAAAWATVDQRRAKDRAGRRQRRINRIRAHR